MIYVKSSSIESTNRFNLVKINKTFFYQFYSFDSITFISCFQKQKNSKVAHYKIMNFQKITPWKQQLVWSKKKWLSCFHLSRLYWVVNSLTTGSAGAGCLNVVLVTNGGMTLIWLHCSGSCPTWIALVAKPFGCALNSDIIFFFGGKIFHEWKLIRKICKWHKWRQKSTVTKLFRQNEMRFSAQTKWKSTCFPAECENWSICQCADYCTTDGSIVNDWKVGKWYEVLTTSWHHTAEQRMTVNALCTADCIGRTEQNSDCLFVYRSSFQAIEWFLFELNEWLLTCKYWQCFRY